MTAYSSSETALMLGIAPITLRKLSNAFAAWLSPGAAGMTMDGEIGDRVYNDDDLETLRYVIVLLRQNRHYSWVRERLTAELGAADSTQEQTEAEAAEPEQVPTNQAPPVVVINTGGAWQTELEQTPPLAEAAAIEPEYDATIEPAHAEDAEVFQAADAPEDPAREAPYIVDAEVVDPESPVPPDIAAMLERMAALYQELLRNKDQEIVALRQALDMTELSAANERRELETLNRLVKMMERENQRLTVEVEEARQQLGQGTAQRGWFARLFGGDKETGSAQHSESASSRY